MDGQAVRDAVMEVANSPGTEILPGEWEQAKQALATAAAINLHRIVAWLEGVPRTVTRTSAFAALAA